MIWKDPNTFHQNCIIRRQEYCIFVHVPAFTKDSAQMLVNKYDLKQKEYIILMLNKNANKGVSITFT